MTLTLVAVMSGLYMTWLRGSRPGDVPAIAISFNGVAMLLALCAALTALGTAAAFRWSRENPFAIGSDPAHCTRRRSGAP